jgi:hypothetical protein
MKKSLAALLIACFVAVGVTGCAKEEKVDTAALQSAFSAAPADIKEMVDKAVAALGANDYKSAISLLATVITKTNELGQAQLDAAGLAFATANSILQTRGSEIAAAEAKAKKAELEAQGQGTP